MVFAHHLLLAENERAFISIFFFVATVVENLLDNPVLFKNVGKKLLLILWGIIGSDVIEIK